jgi:hypothetical protein
MNLIARNRRGLIRLELLLMLATLALLFQLFPSLVIALSRALDLRYWPAGVWLSVNVAILIALLSQRFGAEFYMQRRQRRPRRSSSRQLLVKQSTLNEERALYERMNEARKRQVI